MSLLDLVLVFLFILRTFLSMDGFGRRFAVSRRMRFPEFYFILFFALCAVAGKSVVIGGVDNWTCPSLVTVSFRHHTWQLLSLLVRVRGTGRLQPSLGSVCLDGRAITIPRSPFAVVRLYVCSVERWIDDATDRFLFGSNRGIT